MVRVPALLARSPTANIKELGLERLQIMPCEPQHDLKGVLSNTLTELERHLPAPAADSYKKVIGVTVGRQQSRGCDWREAVCLLAKQATTWESCPQKAKHLLRNLADISSNLYAGEEERTPKMVLRLTSLDVLPLFEKLPETRQKHVQRGLVRWLPTWHRTCPYTACSRQLTFVQHRGVGENSRPG